MKISKTIKRLRNEKGITQEELANMLFISRQSVSSWENDRTQPDIEMLDKLTAVFDVSIEELIYGKKRNTALETEKTNYNNTLLIVFSILGTLLAGTGIVFIFVYFWQKLPLFSKAILSFIPLLAGQAAGVYVLLRKKDNIPWCEGAGMLWTAGIAATLIMIYNIFELIIDWYVLLILLSILILPAILLLNAVSPIAVFYGCIIAWFFTGGYHNPLFTIILSAVLLATGTYYTSHLIKAEKKSLRSIAAQWLSIIACFTFTASAGTEISGNIITLITGTGASGLILLMLSLKDEELIMPYRIPGLLLTSIMLFANGGAFFGSTEKDAENIIFTALMYLGVIITFIFTKNKMKDKLFSSYIAVSCLSFLIFSFGLFLFPDRSTDSAEFIFISILKIIALASNIILMIWGGKSKRLIPINTGFISVAALTILIVSQSGLSLIGNGILLLIFGALLLAVNFRISRQNQKITAVNNETEVSSDDKKI